MIRFRKKIVHFDVKYDRKKNKNLSSIKYTKREKKKSFFAKNGSVRWLLFKLLSRTERAGGVEIYKKRRKADKVKNECWNHFSSMDRDVKYYSWRWFIRAKGRTEYQKIPFFIIIKAVLFIGSWGVRIYSLTLPKKKFRLFFNSDEVPVIFTNLGNFFSSSTGWSIRNKRYLKL